MRLVLLITLLLISDEMFPQFVKWNVVPIDKTQYGNCPVVQPSLKKPSKGKDTIATDEMKFAILGSFKTVNSFTLMKSIPDNKYYLTNEDTGLSEELLGFPVFSASLKKFVCLGDASGRQLIRLYEIQKDKLNVKFEVPITKPATEINCVTDSSFYLKDISEGYWKYAFHDAK